MTLTTYKMLIPAVPFPYESTVEALNLDGAIRKIMFQAKSIGVVVCSPKYVKANLTYEIMRVRTV